MQKYEPRHRPHTHHKAYIKIDHRPKYKNQNYKTPRRKHRRKPRKLWVWEMPF